MKTRAPSPFMVRRAACLLMLARTRSAASSPVRPAAQPQARRVEPLRRPEPHETPLSHAEINHAIAHGICSCQEAYA